MRRKRMTNGEMKYYAQTAVTSALHNGTLIRKPCELCGAIRTHAHHPDYSKRLEVRWLCPSHHSQEHARLEKGGINLCRLHELAEREGVK